MPTPASAFLHAGRLRLALGSLRGRERSLHAKILLTLGAVAGVCSLVIAAANVVGIRHERELEHLSSIIAPGAPNAPATPATRETASSGRRGTESSATVSRQRAALPPRENRQLAQMVAGLHFRARTWRRTGTLISFALLGSGVGVIWWLARHLLLRPLKDSSDQLERSGEQVDATVTSFVETSQRLSTSAAQTAGALRVSTATLQDLGTVSQANCDRAQRAKELARRSLQAATAGSASMQELDASMSTLQRSSGDVEKIIRTIDDIAFQTSILALNAAVEAARAGRAGAGFAVVADEVRRLAHHATQSARDTAEKITEATQHSQQCVALSRKVAGNLADVAARAREVDTLVFEIASTSKDQAAGIGQLARVMGDIDLTTHHNAALGAETAEVANRLGERTRWLHRLTQSLTGLVTGPRVVEPAASFRTEGFQVSLHRSDAASFASSLLPLPAVTPQPLPDRTLACASALRARAASCASAVDGFEEF